MTLGAAYSGRGGGGATVLLADYSFSSGSGGGTEIDFADNSFDGGNTITGYLWDFDDAGATSTEPSPTHTFTAPGTFSVSLKVTDDLLNTNETIRPLVISGANIPPVANFTYEANLLEVTFTDTSTDADGTVVAWFWDFDDD